MYSFIYVFVYLTITWIGREPALVVDVPIRVPRRSEQRIELVVLHVAGDLRAVRVFQRDDGPHLLFPLSGHGARVHVVALLGAQRQRGEQGSEHEPVGVCQENEMHFNLNVVIYFDCY